MKKKFLIITLGIIVLIILSISLTILSSLKVLTTDQKMVKCGKMTNESIQAECYHEIFDKNSDTSLCEQVERSHLKYDCYKSIAINTNQPELCDNVFGRIYCYSEVAVELNNRSICDSIEGFFSYTNQNNFVTGKDYCKGAVGTINK